MSSVALDLAAMCPHREDADVAHVAQHDGLPCPYWRVAQLLAGLRDPMDDVVEWPIELPLPGGKPPLSLNDRGLGWAAHANKVERIKALTRNAVRDADVPMLAHVHVELHYRPRDNRVRDADNLVATLKPIIDALHQPDTRSLWTPILLGDDDRYVTWSRPRIHRAVKGEPAATWIVLRTYVAPAGV